MKAENKWDKEEDYIFLKKWIECNLKTDENLGIDKAIYEKLPKVIMQENKSELIDLSFINLSNLSFGKVWMGHYLSHANLSGSKFLRTHFHHAVAVDTDFSGSFFERAQFIPFFSPNSNFENCVFKDCLAFGSGGNPKDNYSYNNFDKKKKKNIKMSGCDFSKSNFKNSNFDNAEIEDSKFEGAIFLNENLKNSLFNNCSFSSLEYDGVNDFITNINFSCFDNVKFINCNFQGVNIKSIKFLL